MQSRVGLITKEEDGRVTLVVYRDHEHLALVDLTLHEQFDLHQKLNKALYKYAGLKTHLLP